MVEPAIVVSAAAAASGIASLVGKLASTLATRHRVQEDDRRLSESAQSRALESANLDTLGSYLVDDIGGVRIADVVSNRALQRSALGAFARVASYVSGDAALSGDAGGESQTSPAPTVTTGELAIARDRILAGEVWDGLALMRRHIELLLRSLDPRLEEARLGAGRLIAAADRLQLLPPQSVPQLRYVVAVANRAIHGENLDVEVALEAVDVAAQALEGVKAAQGPRRA